MKIFKILNKIKNNPDILKANISYAQEGEDLILSAIFNEKNDGFYVDVGAHHPSRFSNTKIFYDKGWSGINIEPCNIDRFAKKRPRDKNIQAAIGQVRERKTFYIFDDEALNTFDSENIERYKKSGYKLVEQVEMQLIPLKEIIEENSVKKIDFMSVDVEGLEMEVLNSFDWNSLKPDVLLIEIHDKLENLLDNKIYLFLTKLGYEFLAKTTRTAIFKIKNDNS